jgi:cholesterol transport system auxiliary component
MKHLFRHPSSFAFFAMVIAVAASACALTSKAEVVDVRYFSPERIEPRRDNKGPTLIDRATGSNVPLEVRLGRVSSGPNLRERIAFRNTAYELGYYEDLRWTERPETYVRREIGRSLFETQGMRRVLSGTAPTLDVEVIAFDELRLMSGRAVRVQLRVILYEDAGVILEDTLTIDRPVLGEKPKIEEVIAAMATALDATADQVALKVQRALVLRQLITPTVSAL